VKSTGTGSADTRCSATVLSDGRIINIGGPVRPSVRQSVVRGKSSRYEQIPNTSFRFQFSILL